MIVTTCPATVMLPLRGLAVALASTEYVNVPLPVPFPPLTIVIQLSLLTADHAQALVVVTVTAADPPPAAIVWVVGEIAYEQGVGAAAWVTVTVRPAMVSVPDRGDVAWFCATLSDTLPFPVPLPPLATAIHVTLLVAVHVHVLPDVTVTVAVPPVSAAEIAVGDTVYEQLAGADCVTVTVCPATVSVPVREAVDVFASTV